MPSHRERVVAHPVSAALAKLEEVAVEAHRGPDERAALATAALEFSEAYRLLRGVPDWREVQL